MQDYAVELTESELQKATEAVGNSTGADTRQLRGCCRKTCSFGRLMRMPEVAWPTNFRFDQSSVDGGKMSRDKPIPSLVLRSNLVVFSKKKS